MRIMCGELIKTARAADGANSIGFDHAVPVLSSPLPRFFCGCVVSLLAPPS